MVERLIARSELRIAAAAWEVNSIRLEDRYLVLGYDERAHIERLRAKCGRRLRIVDERSAYLPLENEDGSPEEILKVAKSLLLSD